MPECVSSPAWPPGDGDHTLSIVVPLHNEEDNVLPLVEQVCEALAGLTLPWQLVLVDDGSTDATAMRVEQAWRLYPARVCALILRRNFGQTAAMQAGIDAALGSLIATMDGDLQNHPADLLPMLWRLLTEDLDLVAGWRRRRQDGFLLRRLPSWLANRLIVAVTGIRLHDYGCSLKLFRAEVLREVRLYGEMHRFIPTWIATVSAPQRIAEQEVAHFPRRHGQSKYGISRSLRVLLDLAAMAFFLRFAAQPGHFFGRIGFACSFAGLVVLGWLAGEKLLSHASIGGRPLLLLGVLLLVLGVQFVCTGILAEMLARTWFEVREKRSYSVRHRLGNAMAVQPGPRGRQQ